MTTWAVITGEYPPQPGGVSDYTRQVCRGLTAAGDRVTVFAPPCGTTGESDNGVSVVRLPDHFGRRGRAAVERELTLERPDRVLVQYVPHAFGMRAMNVPFAWWVRRLKRLAPVWVTVHEVAFPFVRRPLRHNLIAVVNRLMARLVADAADRLFVTTHAWGDLLRRLAPRCAAPEWLPVPSNLPTDAVPATLPPGVCVGHFGTYPKSTTDLLGPVLVGVLNGSADRVAVLIGRNGAAFRDRFIADHPELCGRVMAAGELSADDTAAHLAACHVLVQPYPDGVSGRRTSATSALALGVPLATNLGVLSEGEWAIADNGVSLATQPTAAELVATTDSVLALAPAGRTARGEAGRRWYAERFALDRVIATLRGEGDR